MPLDRRQLILGAAAVIVLGLAIWTFWPAPTPAPAATAQARARSGRGNAPAAGGPVDPVRLDALTASAERSAPGEAQRNPFRFQPKVVAPPPPSKAAAPMISDAPPKPVISAPAGPPPPQPIALKFVGVLQRADGTKWAVLTDGKSPTPMYGKTGDIIDGKYLIQEIGTESIVMTHTDGRGRQVIRLTGQ